MPLLQNDSWGAPIGAALAAAGEITGGIAKRKKDEEARKRQAEIDRQNAAAVQAAITRDTLGTQMAMDRDAREREKANRETDTATSVAAYRAGIKPPKPGKTTSASAQAYRDAATEALRAGDTVAASQFEKMASDLELGNVRESTATLNRATVPLRGAQTDLTRAKAEREKHWRDELKMKFDAAQSKMGAQQKASMQRAMATANAAMGRAQFSASVREGIAMQSALNAAQGMSEQQAFQVAMRDYQTRSTAWEAQMKQYSSGKMTPEQQQATGFNPQQPPTINLNMASPSQPQVVPIVITMPDGSKKTVPIVQRAQPHANKPPTQGDPVSKAVEAVKHLPHDQQAAAIEGARSLTDQQKNEVRKRLGVQPAQHQGFNLFNPSTWHP